MIAVSKIDLNIARCTCVACLSSIKSNRSAKCERLCTFFLSDLVLTSSDLNITIQPFTDFLRLAELFFPGLTAFQPYMTSKRHKSTEESPEETRNVKSLPKVPESEVQEFKRHESYQINRSALPAVLLQGQTFISCCSMYLFRSAGTGKVLEVSDSSKKQAEELFASLDISLIDLPTGADWPVLPLVTTTSCSVKYHVLYDKIQCASCNTPCGWKVLKRRFCPLAGHSRGIAGPFC